MKQLGLRFSKDPRGGARDGAERKALPARLRHTPHRARAKHRAAHPVHVTMRSSLRSLRSQYVVRTVLGALRHSNRERFRIVHHSVQANHLHLIVEADDKGALSSGMRGLAVRLARRVNKLLFRRGMFWADRWHGHTLESPRQVRNALVYVLQNHKKHSRSKLAPALDAYSSAEWFDGFAKPIPSSFRSIGQPSVCLPQTWLLRVGWRRRGRISVSEVPRSVH
jgi:putative transposase